jgi:hypothetical protein
MMKKNFAGRSEIFPAHHYGIALSWPGSSRPSTSSLMRPRKTWMPGTSPGMTLSLLIVGCEAETQA